jgi:hypothetical protein
VARRPYREGSRSGSSEPRRATRRRSTTRTRGTGRRCVVPRRRWRGRRARRCRLSIRTVGHLDDRVRSARPGEQRLVPLNARDVDEVERPVGERPGGEAAGGVWEPQLRQAPAPTTPRRRARRRWGDRTAPSSLYAALAANPRQPQSEYRHSRSSRSPCTNSECSQTRQRIRVDSLRSACSLNACMQRP